MCPKKTLRDHEMVGEVLKVIDFYRQLIYYCKVAFILAIVIVIVYGISTLLKILNYDVKKDKLKFVIPVLDIMTAVSIKSKLVLR